MLASNVGVFVPQETDALFYYHFNKCGLLGSIQVYNDLSQFRNSKHQHKLACLQMPYPVRPEFDVTINDLLSVADNILILVSELHDRTVEIIQRHDNSRISYFICGELNFSLESSPVHKFYDWFTTSIHFYKHVRPETLDVLKPYNTKPFFFDCLLGRKKPHRDYAFSRMPPEGNIVTYLGDHSCNFNDPDKWQWEDEGLEIDQTVEWTVDRLPYYGHRMSISQIVPLSIYNKTAYSLVAETNYSNHYTFYTEKTIKPILGRRLFITLAGQGHLANLRALGFKTFDGIIDETYDSINHNESRFEMAMKELVKLMYRPQDEVIFQTMPICEHNFNHLINVDWYMEYFAPAFAKYFSQ